MLTWLQKNSHLVLAVILLVVAGLWVHDHTQQAVARALVKQQLDSITVKVKQDSIDAAVRDSVANAALLQAAENEKAARAFAQAAHQSMHAALDSLSTMKTAGDSIVVYQQALAHADTVIAQQANAITAADAQIAGLQKQVLDRDGQIAVLRGITQDLQKKVEKATHVSPLNGTVVTIVKTYFMVKGVYDTVRGQ